MLKCGHSLNNLEIFLDVHIWYHWIQQKMLTDSPFQLAVSISTGYSHCYSTTFTSTLDNFLKLNCTLGTNEVIYLSFDFSVFNFSVPYTNLEPALWACVWCNAALINPPPPHLVVFCQQHFNRSEAEVTVSGCKNSRILCSPKKISCYTTHTPITQTECHIADRRNNSSDITFNDEGSHSMMKLMCHFLNHSHMAFDSFHG